MTARGQEGASYVVTPTEHVRRMFATFHAKDVSGLAAFLTDDVRLRLGNSDRIR
jgi:ketosteroid isomerase-like protein